FDTWDRRFYRQAESSYDNHLKLRVKEYAYLGDDGKYLSFPTCFVEIKARRSGVVTKRRVPIARRDLGRLFQGEDVWDSVVAAVGHEPSQNITAAYVTLKRFIDRFETQPASLVSYRRSVYQESEGTLRITFDDQVSVFDAHPEHCTRPESLTPAVLGEPVTQYPKVILEVKCPSDVYPEWLRSALADFRSRNLSKFTTSVRSLAGRTTDRPTGHAEGRGQDFSGGGLSGGESGSSRRDDPDTKSLQQPIQN
ncbi:MAG: VTC domain-containing protein, partial [Planctomycetota bacterium]